MTSSKDNKQGSFIDLSRVKNENWFNDFKIVFTDDKSECPANRTLFASKNDFFRKKLADGNVVNIDHAHYVQPKKPTIDLVTKYFMFDESDLNLDTNLVDSVLIFSDMINEKGLFNKCIDFIKTNMNEDNFVKFWALARMLKLDNLKIFIRNFVKKNFKKLYDEDKFLDMDYDLMTDILRSGKLNTDSEETVFFFLKKWLEHNTAGRLQYYEPLIQLIRLKNLTVQFRENQIEPFCSKHKLTNAKQFMKHTQDAFREEVTTIANIDINLEEMPQYDDFLEMSFDELDSLLKLDYEGGVSQRFLLLNLIQWVEHDPINRQKFKARLFENIHLDDLTIEFILDNFNESQLEYENKPLWKSLKRTLNNVVNIEPKLLSAQEYNETLLVVGNQAYSPNSVGVKYPIEIFSKESNKWEKFYHLALECDMFTSAIIDNQLLIIGGRKTGYQIFITNWVQSFNFKTQKLEDLPNMNNKRLHATATVVDGIVYVCGGLSNESAMNSVEMWKPKSSSWTLCHPMLTQRQQHAATKWHRKIYVFGGYSKIGLTNKVEFYDPKKDKWTNAAPMNKALGRLTVSTLNDSIYVMGGNESEHNKIQSVNIYHPETDTWTASFDMMEPLSCFASTMLNEKIYTSGGLNGDGKSIKAVYEFDPKTGKWSKHSEMQGDRYYHSMLVVPNDLIM